jgi:sodium/bile acid cotransporter 7
LLITLPNGGYILLCRLLRIWYVSIEVANQIFSSLVFGLVCAIIASGTDAINMVILVGLVVMGCIPTTISSNVVMTRAAKGNDSVSLSRRGLTQATLIEVTIGNTLGPFLSPALTRMYLSSSSAFDDYVPGVGGVGQLYGAVFKQLGCAVFAPFIVGQLLQLLFPKQTNWAMRRVTSQGFTDKVISE